MPDQHHYHFPLDYEAVSKVFRTLYVPHNHSDPQTLQWRLVAAYDRKFPDCRFIERLQREGRRSRQILMAVAAEVLFGRDWHDEPNRITERLVLNTRYSDCASPQNLDAAKREIDRRRALDPDFDRRRKNAEHRGQERNAPIRSDDLVIFMARNWTNPSVPLWMVGVDGGAALCQSGLKTSIQNARFKTARDRLDLHSFSKRPLVVKRWRDFEIKPMELTTEARNLLEDWEKADPSVSGCGMARSINC